MVKISKTSEDKGTSWRTRQQTLKEAKSEKEVLVALNQLVVEDMLFFTWKDVAVISPEILNWGVKTGARIGRNLFRSQDIEILIWHPAFNGESAEFLMEYLGTDLGKGLGRENITAVSMCATLSNLLGKLPETPRQKWLARIAKIFQDLGPRALEDRAVWEYQQDLGEILANQRGLPAEIINMIAQSPQMNPEALCALLEQDLIDEEWVKKWEEKYIDVAWRVWKEAADSSHLTRRINKIPDKHLGRLMIDQENRYGAAAFLYSLKGARRRTALWYFLEHWDQKGRFAEECQGQITSEDIKDLPKNIVKKMLLSTKRELRVLAQMAMAQDKSLEQKSGAKQSR